MLTISVEKVLGVAHVRRKRLDIDITILFRGQLSLFPPSSPQCSQSLWQMSKRAQFSWDVTFQAAIILFWILLCKQ